METQINAKEVALKWIQFRKMYSWICVTNTKKSLVALLCMYLAHNDRNMSQGEKYLKSLGLPCPSRVVHMNLRNFLEVKTISKSKLQGLEWYINSTVGSAERTAKRKWDDGEAEVDESGNMSEDVAPVEGEIDEVGAAE